MKLVKELTLPTFTREQLVAFAIYCALEAEKDKAFTTWATDWLSGKDRTAETAAWAAGAGGAARAAEAARAGAAARAAEAAAWGAVRAARAARAGGAAEAAEAAAWAAWAAVNDPHTVIDFEHLLDKAEVIE